MPEPRRTSRWYFGGLASASAACCTHPLDLIKVHLQTQQEVKYGVVRSVSSIVGQHGVFALYSGLSASLLRQLTYSTTRFGVYEVCKQRYISGNNCANDAVPFHIKILLAASAGACGGFIGTPADMVNVRMQNDVKLARAQRRNYRHCVHGLICVYRDEGGLKPLFSGASAAVLRAILMSVGQLSFYDQAKHFLISSGFFSDTMFCHIVSSCIAGGAATTFTQPVDVIKTRVMNARVGEYKSLFHVVTHTAKLGPMSFFKGYVPAFVRLGPHTVITFVILEQMRLNFGYISVRQQP